MSGFLTRIIDRQLNTANLVAPQTSGRYEPTEAATIFQPGQRGFSAGSFGEKGEVNIESNEKYFDKMESINNVEDSLIQDNPQQKRNLRKNIMHVQPVQSLQQSEVFISNSIESSGNKKDDEISQSLRIADQLMNPANFFKAEGPDQNKNFNTEPNLLIDANSAKKVFLNENDAAGTKKISAATLDRKTRQEKQVGSIKSISEVETVQHPANEKEVVVVPSFKEANEIRSYHPVVKPVVDRNPSTQAAPENSKRSSDKNRESTPKLIIGKITVEILPPVAPIAPKIITRVVQSTSPAKHSKINRLSFGLGQL